MCKHVGTYKRAGDAFRLRSGLVRVVVLKSAETGLTVVSVDIVVSDKWMVSGVIYIA